MDLRNVFMLMELKNYFTANPQMAMENDSSSTVHKFWSIYIAFMEIVNFY